MATEFRSNRRPAQAQQVGQNAQLRVEAATTTPAPVSHNGLEGEPVPAVAAVTSSTTVQPVPAVVAVTMPTTGAPVPGVAAATTSSTSGATIPVPAHATQAIRDYVHPNGFTVVSKRRGECSSILNWGVRVTAALDDKEYLGWICQGSHECHRQNKFIQLFGNTTKATKLLSEGHLVSAAKVIAESKRKRDRAEQLERFRSAISNGDDSRRMTFLLETMRVVNNNLPFRIGEYEESKLLADLTLCKKYRVTLNHQTVFRAIAELYSSARSAACSYIDRSRLVGVPVYSVVCDFLASKTQKSTKYVGLRLYFIDHEWKFQSILLGTRHYEPMYGERSEGNREPFKRWALELLKDFGLANKDL